MTIPDLLSSFKKGYLYSYETQTYKVLMECMSNYEFQGTIQFKDIQLSYKKDIAPEDGKPGQILHQAELDKTYWSPEIEAMRLIKLVGPMSDYPELML